MSSKLLNAVTFPFRVLLRKAKFPDEPIVKGQLKAGTNVTITTEENDDITVAVESGGGIDDGTINGAMLAWNESESKWEEQTNILANKNNDTLELIFGEFINGSQYGLRLSGFVSFDGPPVLIDGSVDGLNKFRVHGNGQVQSWFHEGVGDRYLGVDSEGRFKEMTLPEGLADGTVLHSTLRWDGTDWVESVKHLASISVSENSYTVFSPDGNVRADIAIRNSQNAFFLNFLSGKYSYLWVDASSSYLDLNQGSGRGRVYIQARHTYSGANEIIRIAYGATNYFIVKQDGTIFSNVLTANTVLVANANKEIVSLANSTDGKVLTLVDGVPVWADACVDSQIQSDWSQDDTDAVDYIKNKPTIPADISELTDTTNLLFSKDYNDLSNKPTIPENKASFVVSPQTFYNTNWEFPLTEPSTSFADVSGLSVTLKPHKKYAVEIQLMFNVNTSIAWNAQLKVLNGGGDWFSALLINYSPSKSLSKVIDIYNNTQDFTRRNDTLGFDEEYPIGYGTFTGTDSNGVYERFEIKGIIETYATGGDLKVQFRNIWREGVTNAHASVIFTNSFIKAVECT